MWMIINMKLEYRWQNLSKNTIRAQNPHTSVLPNVITDPLRPGCCVSFQESVLPPRTTPAPTLRMLITAKPLQHSCGSLLCAPRPDRGASTTNTIISSDKTNNRANKTPSTATGETFSSPPEPAGSPLWMMAGPLTRLMVVKPSVYLELRLHSGFRGGGQKLDRMGWLSRDRSWLLDK